MIYTGYMRPFEMQLVNKIELINDTVIILCSYFLVIFSGFVGDPEAKYLSAWPLIGLIFFFIGLNLIVVMGEACRVKSVIRGIRLRLKRNKNRREMLKTAKSA